MSSAPRWTSPLNRRPTKRRFNRPNYRPARPAAPPRRIFQRHLERPAFRDRRVRPQDVAMLLGVFLGLIGVLCLSFLLFSSYYAQRVSPHISVDGIAMGGVALNSAPAYLRERIAQRNARPLVF